MRFRPGDEWLEPDGRGGFASGTVSGVRTRRYHALLLPALAPPGGRMVLVNGLDVWVEGKAAVSAQRWASGAVSPDGDRRLVDFVPEPWPRWTWRFDDGSTLEQELFATYDAPITVLAWRGSAGGVLVVRPFLSGRDYHALHQENRGFGFEPEVDDRAGTRLVFRPYPGVPPTVMLANGAYRHEPHWYRGFAYEEERARGLDFIEDLAAPGTLRYDLGRGEAVLVLTCDEEALAGEPGETAAHLRLRERARRWRLAGPLERAAAAYLVRRGRGLTVTAGYPWFCDWGRDTFIALRGLCLATGRLEEARRILTEWAGTVSEGMLPNRFAEGRDAPEYNSVDASLWFCVAARAYLDAAARARHPVSADDRAAIETAVIAIVDGYARGTRLGIRADWDGLLAAGAAGSQLTWMDARADGQEVTPRIGKPVEVQALWVNALRIAADLRLPSSERWETLAARGHKAFGNRFWHRAGGYLYDVVDENHVAGACDDRLRPNQILAVGGLPFPLVEGERAAQVVNVVEERLLTPMGLRSLAPGARGYVGRYQGGVVERDRAYHNGTVWPWLLGPFVEAWVRVRGGTDEARREARDRFVAPLAARMDAGTAGGIGGIAEIADGDAPHEPRGCPFQAWSVAEVIRLLREVLVV
jgi:predicted glycogen debranching enzyme